MLRANRAIAFTALAAAFAATIRTHWYFIRPFAVPTGLDEGYITALGQRMILGHWLPYVDGVSQRGPLTYWIAAAAMRVGGLFSWMPLRALSLGLALVTLVLVFLLGLELFSPFVAGIAVLTVAYFSNYEIDPMHGVGFNGEIATLPFLLLSALLVARMQNRPEQAASRAGSRSRTAWLIAAGALAALAGLTKQIGLIHVVPAVLWLFLGPRRPAASATRGPDLASYLFGFAMPFAVVLTIYSASGHLSEFVYYYQRYGRAIYMDPVTWEFMRDTLHEQVNAYSLGIVGVSLLALLSLGRAVRALLTAPAGEAGRGAIGLGGFMLGRARTHAPILFTLLHFFGAVAGASFPFRFFGHYFLEAFPFIGLLAGYAVSESFDAGGDGSSRSPLVIGELVVVAGSIALLALAASSLSRSVGWRRGSERWDRWYQDPQTDLIVRYVKATTRPYDTIFVWGFRSEIHVSAHRYPASRFVYSIYPSGFVPWFRNATREEEARRVVPGSQELLMRDLEVSQAELVIDAGATLYDRYMGDIPVFRRYLAEHYCPMGRVDAEPIYRRRRGDDCPPPDAQ